MASKYRWYGKDINPNQFLTAKPGTFIMRLKSRDVYEVWVKVNRGYMNGNFYYSIWVSNFDKDDGWKRMGKFTGTSAEEYRKKVVSRIGRKKCVLDFFSDLMQCTDLSPLLGYFGWAPKIYTENEVRIRLNKALGK